MKFTMLLYKQKNCLYCIDFVVIGVEDYKKHDIIMLSSFFIQNFRSILELKLDFSYGEGKAPNRYLEQDILPFLEAPNKQRLVPCMAFFGANASGKTNLLKAFIILRAMIRDGGPLNQLFDPNLLNKKHPDTTFEVEFILNDGIFKCRVIYNATEILQEAMFKNGKTIYAIHRLKPEFPQINSDTYSPDKLSDILRVECSDGAGRQTKTFLNRIGLGYPGLNEDLKNAFNFFKEDLKINIGDYPNPFLLTQAVELLASILGGDEKAALGEITDVVRRLDIDIDAIDIVKTKLPPDRTVPASSITKFDQKTGITHAMQITSTHQDVTGNPTLLDFTKHESDGTQRLAGLIGVILYTLKIGGVLLVDELERSLHPLLMREIVMMFKKHRHNPKGAQLIFTTHNTDILDDSILRLSEIALVRKTMANGTLIRRLVDAKNDGEDIRNVTNFRKQYLAGFYAGIPHPAL